MGHFPNAVLDVTVNTDFAQADVDRALVNLERFNIFFPERRQFFLENSGIWSGGANTFFRPFFSRTIGLEGTFNATPAPIDVGTRFTDKNKTGQSPACMLDKGKQKIALQQILG